MDARFGRRSTDRLSTTSYSPGLDPLLASQLKRSNKYQSGGAQNGDDRNLSSASGLRFDCAHRPEATMNGLIYIVGLVVVIMFILSFLGLR
jgi:hypothetical protein